jgi:hypothetical protein
MSRRCVRPLRRLVQADLAVAQARVHADIWNILTPEQQTKAKELEQQAQARSRASGSSGHRERQSSRSNSRRQVQGAGGRIHLPFVLIPVRPLDRLRPARSC